MNQLAVTVPTGHLDGQGTGTQTESSLSGALAHGLEHLHIPILWET